MATHTFRDGKWFDKQTGEEVQFESKAHTWTPGSLMRVSIDYTNYRSPITGEPITSKRQHEDALKKAGCRVLEPGESREAPKRREEAARQKLDRDVDRAVNSLANMF